MDAVQKTKLLESFARHISRWFKALPARVGEFRQRIAAGLHMSEDEFNAWIKPKIHNATPKSTADSDLSSAVSPPETSIDSISNGLSDSASALKSNWQQPSAPFDPPLGRAAERPVISNSALTFRLVIGDKDLDEAQRLELEALIAEKNAARNGKLDKERAKVLKKLLSDTGCSTEFAVRRKPIDDLRADVQESMNGWPYRLKLGSLLRMKRNGGFELINKSERFNAMLQEYGDVRFKEKTDSQGSNYVSRTELFHSFMRSEEVREFLAVERAPFEPPIEGHLIDWKAPQDYEPTGEYFVKFCQLFDNIPEFPHRALFAAAALTVLWGGAPAKPYGVRPVMALEASEVGSGKSTAVELISGWTTEYVTLDLDKRTEERLRTRLLSGDNELTSRILLLDNVKIYLDSGFLEGFVTQSWISGEVKYGGEGRRPNTFTMFVSGNNLRVSTDFARRFFFIHFTKQEKPNEWEADAWSFVHTNRAKILADALLILRQPLPAVDWNRNIKETNKSWCRHVLGRVCKFEPLKEWLGGVDAEDVIYLNQVKRGTADMEVEEANAIREGVLESLCSWRHWYYKGPDDFKLPERSGQPFDPVIRAQAPKKGFMIELWDGSTENASGTENVAVITENNMLAWMTAILSNQKKTLTASLVARIIEKHRGAKRIDWMEPVHRECGSCYMIYREAIEAWLKERWERSQTPKSI